MKYQKLIVIITISCVLYVVSVGAAMAELEGCGDGLLINEELDGSLRITGDEPCTIISSTIGGNIHAINLPYVLLMNNKVGGYLRIDGNAGIGTANVIANTVLRDYIVVNELQDANVIENETLADGIYVVNNVNALVQKNISKQELICIWNTDLDSFFNFAGGTLNCGNEPEVPEEPPAGE